MKYDDYNKFYQTIIVQQTDTYENSNQILNRRQNIAKQIKQIAGRPLCETENGGIYIGFDAENDILYCGYSFGNFGDISHQIETLYNYNISLDQNLNQLYEMFSQNDNGIIKHEDYEEEEKYTEYGNNSKYDGYENDYQQYPITQNKHKRNKHTIFYQQKQENESEYDEQDNINSNENDEQSDDTTKDEIVDYKELMKLKEMFQDSINEEYYNNNGSQYVEISGVKFQPKEIFKKCTSDTDYRMAFTQFLQDFTIDVQKIDYNAFDKIIEQRL